MSKYQKFIFKDYSFNQESGELLLQYSYDDELNFTEKYIFDFEIKEYNQAAFRRAAELLFFLAGVSYYKMYLAPEIVINKGSIDDYLSKFLSRTYQNGLKEFLFVNRLDLNYKISFPFNS